MNFDITVIIPTFNECENIARLIDRISGIFKSNDINGEILVVDDSSKDGTIEIVTNLMKYSNNVSILVRKENPGLSESVIDGFNHARSDILLVIDADFSHPPELIPVFLREIKNGNDIVIGSRYIAGGQILEWPLKRKIISRGATFLARCIVPKVHDPVSGYFAIKHEVLEGSTLKPRGYKILLEILGKGRWRCVKEIPFTFRDRIEGNSKLKGNTIVVYALQVADITRYKISYRKN